MHAAIYYAFYTQRQPIGYAHSNEEQNLLKTFAIRLTACMQRINEVCARRTITSI